MVQRGKHDKGFQGGGSADLNVEAQLVRQRAFVHHPALVRHVGVELSLPCPEPGPERRPGPRAYLSL